MKTGIIIDLKLLFVSLIIICLSVSILVNVLQSQVINNLENQIEHRDFLINKYLH